MSDMDGENSPYICKEYWLQRLDIIKEAAIHCTGKGQRPAPERR
jgi:hypothetical protein